MNDDFHCYINDVLKTRGKNNKMLQNMNGIFQPMYYDYEQDKDLDPDIYSQELYDDIADSLSGPVNKHTTIKFCTSEEKGRLSLDFFLNGEKKDEFRCSTDYIGPSCNWAHEIGVCDKMIGTSLKECRILGGHLVWPIEESINQAKGGRGIYDRIDLCLDEIRNYYLCEKKNAKHKDFLMNRILRNRSWFDIFGQGEDGFKSFIRFFKLDNFVTEKFEVISLSLSDIATIYTIQDEDERIEKAGKIDTMHNCYCPGRQFNETTGESNNERKERIQLYKKYMNNCICLIKQRESKMHICT